MELRHVVIAGEKQTGSLVFDPQELNDSEALNRLLSSIDPGDRYTVVYFPTNSAAVAKVIQVNN